MSNRPQVPRKRMYHAHDRKMILVKGLNESSEHVLMKAFLWALYLPDYPTLTVEIRIGDRYKPDVVALDAAGNLLFWGEAGPSQYGESAGTGKTLSQHPLCNCQMAHPT